MLQTHCCYLRLETCGRIIAILDTIKCLLYIGAYSFVLDDVPAMVKSLGKDKADMAEVNLITKCIYLVVFLALVSNATVILTALLLFVATYWYSYKFVFPWIVLNFSNMVYFIIILILLRTTSKNHLTEYKSWIATFGYLVSLSFSILASFIVIQLFKLQREQNVVLD